MQNFKQYIPAIAAVFLVTVGLLLSIVNKQPEQYRTAYIDVFDTVTQFIGYADSEEVFKERSEILKEKLVTYHQFYDIYNSYEGINNLRTINKNAGIQPVKVSQEIIDLLKFSKELYTLTDGEINIAMGSVLSIWHDYRTKGVAVPPMEILQEANKHTNIENLIIDEDASTVYLADEKMSLDVGSIGKGYAVQMTAEYARELGYDNLIINVGGNVISIGNRADEKDWTFGITNPDLEAQEKVIATVSFSDKSLVTSGDYQRFYTVDGVKYCHIIDPDTLMPAEYFTSVSIITPHSGMADALSTALFNMSYEDGLALIQSIEDAEAIWIFEDGSMKYSEGFEAYIIE